MVSPTTLQRVLRPSAGSTAAGIDLGPYARWWSERMARGRVSAAGAACLARTWAIPYGALWTIVPDPGRMAGDVPTQRYRGARVTLGVLPTGLGLVSIFWSLPCRALGPSAFVAAANLVPMARLRDPLFGPMRQIPGVRRQFVTTLMGARTSPFTEWRPPADGRPPSSRTPDR